MQLRAPNFYNTWTVDTDTKIRRSLGGDLLTPRDPNWATIRSWKMTFSALTTDQKNSLIQFCIQTAGQLITFTDFEGSSWEGVIRNDVLNFKEGRGGGCNWSVEIEFIGRRL